MAVAKKPLYLNADAFMNFLLPLAILGFAMSVWFVLQGKGFAGTSYTAICRTIGAVWALGPPLWFFYEYFHYFPAHGNPDAGFEQLKAHQAMATKVWFGMLLVLAALFTNSVPV
jgi:hypothetical protein